MSYTLRRLTALNGEAILPLPEAKASQRILHAHEDDLLASYRDAAVSYVQRISGIALVPAQYLWAIPRFNTRVDLPMGPVVSVDAVAYHDADGVEQPYADFRTIGGSVYPAASGSWPAAYDYVAVTFTAGLSSPDEAPELLMAAKIQFAINEDRGRSSPEAINQLRKSVQMHISTCRFATGLKG